MTGISDLARTGGPTRERPPFTFAAACRVAFSDTDAQSIVYYGRYAPYFDSARVEYFRNLGFDRARDTDISIGFVMRQFTIDYHAPAQFDDLLEVYCRVAKVGNSSLTFEFAVTNPNETNAAGDGLLLATSTQVLVNVDLAARRPVRISDTVRTAIEGFEHPG